MKTAKICTSFRGCKNSARIRPRVDLNSAVRPRMSDLRRAAPPCLLALLLVTGRAFAGTANAPVDPSSFVGNVYGIVLD